MATKAGAGLSENPDTVQAAAAAARAAMPHRLYCNCALCGDGHGGA